MGLIKKAVKTCLLPRGVRPRTIRGGALRGLKFYLDLQSDTQIWRGVYEQALQQWLTERVKPASICFDVGAAEGWATLLMATLAPRGRIHAFEPSRRGEWIEKNLLLNKGTPRAEVLWEAAAAGARSGDDDHGNRYLSLDDYCEQQRVGRVDVVKIDVDGPELEVLQGADQTIRHHRPALCVEAHSHELCDGVVARLRETSYQVEVVDPPPHEYRPLPYNPLIFGEPK